MVDTSKESKLKAIKDFVEKKAVPGPPTGENFIIMRKNDRKLAKGAKLAKIQSFIVKRPRFDQN